VQDVTGASPRNQHKSCVVDVWYGWKMILKNKNGHNVNYVEL